MEVNISFLQRVSRLALGTIMLTWAIAGGPIWAYMGLLLLATGSWGYCPITRIFKRRL